MNIIQKEDLAYSGFSNDDTNVTGGIDIRVDTESTVGSAIALAVTKPLHASGDPIPLLPGDSGNVGEVLDSLVSRNGDTMIGDLGFVGTAKPVWGYADSRIEYEPSTGSSVWPTLASLPDRTGIYFVSSNAGMPTEGAGYSGSAWCVDRSGGLALAGTSIDKVSYPSTLGYWKKDSLQGSWERLDTGLQPAIGACTDREDVVVDTAGKLWGVAKHYSIPRTTLSLSTPPGVLDGTFTDSTNITVVNPSSCRVMRLTFENVSGYFYTPTISTCSGNFTYGVYTTFGAGMYAFNSLVSPGEDHYYSTANKGYFLSLGGYIDIPPGASCAVQFEVSNPMPTPGTTHPYQEHFASAAFTGNTL